MTGRAGNALVLVGVIVLVVFLVMLSGGRADVLLLVGGAAVSALGLLLRRLQARRERAQGSRFHTLRRILGRDDDAPPDSG
jgi:hypothetical protein